MEETPINLDSVDEIDNLILTMKVMLDSLKSINT